MNGWSIHPPGLSKEERKEIAAGRQAVRRHKKNKAARRSAACE